MTAQVNDTVFFRGEAYNLAAIEGAGLFDPNEHGFTPRYISTAMGRGYCLEYAVSEDQFKLCKVTMTLYEDDPTPTLFGTEPEKSRWERCNWDWCIYKGMDEPIKFSGDVMLGREFVEELYDHMGFHPAWKYKSVFQLSLFDGRVTKTERLDEKIAEMRKKMMRRPMRPSPFVGESEIKEWIEDTFSRKLHSPDEIDDAPSKHPWWKIW